eukprot:SAG25_NODE_9471_length_371_cov_0.834559_1_plen_32_part_01
MGGLRSLSLLLGGGDAGRRRFAGRRVTPLGRL